MGDRLAKKVLVIGWDAADWKHIQPLLDKGWMPNLQKLMDRGAYGNLATLQPILSPMLWNSAATGKRPYKHGIHGFIEPLPDGKGIRPSASTTRKCKAIWNILTQQGYTANVVGWFCGHPAEPINGICISEMFQKVSVRGHGESPDPGNWPLPDGVVHPESLRDEIADLRLHPTELTEEEILPFIPKASKIDQEKDRRLQVFAKLFCEMVSVHAAATFAAEANDWDFMACYYDSVDHFCHAFMEYHPPQMAHVKDEDFEVYQDIITNVYRFHDLILGRLVELAGEDTTVILCSDHGFQCDHLRPKSTPREPAGPAVWHREYGVIVMAGPGIKRGEVIHGASLIDITPTVLTLMGEPVGEDMDGKPLVQAFDEPVWVQRIASWDDVAGECGMHDTSKREDPFEAREAIKQLVELGYIDPPDENEEKAAQNAAQEAKYNVARAYLDGGLIGEATELLAELYEANPEEHRYGLQLARCYLAQRRYHDARELGHLLLDRADRKQRETAEAAEARAKELDERGDELLDEARKAAREAYEKAVAQEKEEAEKEGRDPREMRPIDQFITRERLEKQRDHLATMAERLRHSDPKVTPSAHLLIGTLEFGERNIDAALEHLLAAERAEPRLPGLHNQLGQVYLRMRRNAEARRAFAKALEIDGDSATAHEGMASALHRLEEHEQAVDHALTAVELMHNMPRAHLRLGVTLNGLGLYEQATRAFETCLKLAPMTGAAHRWLSRIYQNRLHKPDLAAEHRLKAEQIRKWRIERRRERLAAQENENA